jgi:ribonuclease HI
LELEQFQLAATKYYVVWRGRQRGVFSSWAECEKQVKGFVGAQYKAFGTLVEARTAFRATFEDYAGRAASAGKWRFARTKPEIPSLCVDAACSGSPGWLEFRGVMTDSGRQAFKAGPFAEGTNNVGEFLAIVEAMRWLRDQDRDWPIYSDSENAIGWVHAKKCRTKLRRTTANRVLFDMIRRAEGELQSVSPGAVGLRRGQRILKWKTAEWGEIPADFGRK